METQDRVIRVTREFDFPRTVVFDAWTDAGKISRWWGPNGFSTTTEELDFKVGGEWRFTMHGPDGTDYPNRIVYTDIKKPECIKYDHFGHKDEDGDPPHFKATINFIEMGDKTRINMQMLFPSVEAHEQAVEYGAVEGATQTLDRSAKFLTEHH